MVGESWRHYKTVSFVSGPGHVAQRFLLHVPLGLRPPPYLPGFTSPLLFAFALKPARSNLLKGDFG